jgi:hypothetical protein
MARHAVVDLSQVVRAQYDPQAPDRLPPETLKRLRQKLAEVGLSVKDGEDADEELSRLRSLYEAYVWGLSRNLRLALPEWLRSERKKDNWQNAPWDRMIQARGLGEHVHVADEHF